MEIKVTKKATIEGGVHGQPKSGGVSIKGAADLDADRFTGTVIVEFFSVDTVTTIEALPEDIERMGTLMRDMRRRINDYRPLCPEHGYYEEEGPHYDCPTCGRNAKVVALGTAQGALAESST